MFKTTLFFGENAPNGTKLLDELEQNQFQAGVEGKWLFTERVVSMLCLLAVAVCEQ